MINELQSNKDLLLTITERDVGNIYNNLKEQVYQICPKQFKPILNNYISANEKKWISTIENYIDIAVESSFPSEETTLEEAIANMNELVNTTIAGFIEDKLKIDPQTLGIVAQLFFGQNV